MNVILDSVLGIVRFEHSNNLDQKEDSVAKCNQSTRLATTKFVNL